ARPQQRCTVDLDDDAQDVLAGEVIVPDRPEGQPPAEYRLLQGRNIDEERIESQPGVDAQAVSWRNQTHCAGWMKGHTMVVLTPEKQYRTVESYELGETQQHSMEHEPERSDYKRQALLPATVELARALALFTLVLPSESMWYVLFSGIAYRSVLTRSMDG